MLRRLVSQVESFQPSNQLDSALIHFAYEHISSEESQLPIALMTFAGKHCAMARFTPKVSFHCMRRNARNSPLSHALKIDVRQTSAVLVFVFLQHNQWTIGSKLVKHVPKTCSKSIKKRPGRVLERGPRAQLVPGSAQKLQEGENYGSWIPWGLSLGFHLRAQHDPEAFQKGF